MYWRSEGSCGAIRRCVGSAANLYQYSSIPTPPTSSSGSESSDAAPIVVTPPGPPGAIAVPVRSCSYSYSPPPAPLCTPPMGSPREPMRPFERTWSEDVVRVVCISDTHSRHDALLEDGRLPQGDVLIHAGDFSNTGTKAQVENFRDFLRAVPHPFKVVIAGNHDITLDEDYYYRTGEDRFHKGRRDGPYFPAELRRMLAGKEAADNGVRYLENEEVTIMGIKFWGSPYTPAYNDWAFGYEPDSEDSQKMWKSCPAGVDVMITHGPPRGIGDLTHRGKRAGCADLLTEIRNRIKPRLNVFGHIHEGYGVYQDAEGIHYVNASTSTLQYRPTQLPIVIDIPLDRSKPLEWVTPVEIHPVNYDEEAEASGVLSSSSSLEGPLPPALSYERSDPSVDCVRW